MKKKYTYMLLALLALLGTHSVAQDLAADMRRMNAHFAEATKLHAKVEVKVFRGNESSPLFSQQAELKRSGTSIWYSIGDLLMVSNTKYTLWINHSSKEIHCRERDRNAAPDLSDFASYSLDSLVDSYDSVAYHGISGGKKHYTIYMESGAVSKADVYLEAGNGRFVKAEYIYRKNAYNDSESRVVVSFPYFNASKTFSPGIFSERPYVEYRDGKFSLTPAYRGYILIENRSPEDD